MFWTDDGWFDDGWPDDDADDGRRRSCVSSDPCDPDHERSRVV